MSILTLCLEEVRVSYEILLNDEKKLVQVIHYEDFDQNVGMKVLPELMNVLAFKRWGNVLVDFREVHEIILSVFEEFIISRNIHKTLPSRIKMGILVSSKTVQNSESQLYKEGELIGSRIEIRLFFSEDEAMVWFD